jgi:hypothetical protein
MSKVSFKLKQTLTAMFIWLMSSVNHNQMLDNPVQLNTHIQRTKLSSLAPSVKLSPVIQDWHQLPDELSVENMNNLTKMNHRIEIDIQIDSNHAHIHKTATTDIYFTSPRSP